MKTTLLEIRVDFRSSQPAFVQLADQIRTAIERGELQPGERLPTVRELARLAGVHFNTAARAYRVLYDDGLITTVRGRGTFVEPGRKAKRASASARLEAQARALLAAAEQAGWSQKQVLELVRRLGNRK